MKAYIYSLRTFGTDEVLYVGSTNDFNRRKNQHFNALDKQVHPSKTLQKTYNTLEGNVYMKCEFTFNDDKFPMRIAEYFYTCALRPKCNKTFNMANGKKYDNMKLCESELAEQILELLI